MSALHNLIVTVRNVHVRLEDRLASAVRAVVFDLLSVCKSV